MIPTPANPRSRLCRWLSILALMFLAVPAMFPQEEEVPIRRHGEPVIGFGRDVSVAADESVPNVVVFYSDAQVAGSVRDALVVFCGDLDLSGEVRGPVVVLFGNLHARSNAVVRGETVVSGGNVQEDPGARFSKQKHVYSLDRFPMVKAALDWFHQGFLYLRLLPPGVKWVWSIPAAFLGLYLFMALVLPKPAQACVSALTERPFMAYGVGILALIVILISLPFLVALGALGVGLILLAALVLVTAFARMTMTQFLGIQLGETLGVNFLRNPFVGLLTGSLMLCALYAVPVVGMLVWIGSFPLALGGLTLAIAKAVGRRRRTEPGTTSLTPATALIPLASPSTPPPPSFEEPRTQERRPAGFFVRCVATFIDLILLGVIGGVFDIHGQFWLLMWVAYHVALWNWQGATLGGKAIGFEIQELDGTRPGFRTAFVRMLAAFLSVIPLFLGFIWAAWDIRKESWHDKLSGTRVIWRRSGSESGRTKTGSS